MTNEDWKALAVLCHRVRPALRIAPASRGLSRAEWHEFCRVLAADVCRRNGTTRLANEPQASHLQAGEVGT